MFERISRRNNDSNNLDNLFRRLTQNIAFSSNIHDELHSALGCNNSLCNYCGAKLFPFECKGNMTQCCQSGKIDVKRTVYPSVLQTLLNGTDPASHHFRTNIRRYNSSF